MAEAPVRTAITVSDDIRDWRETGRRQIGAGSPVGEPLRLDPSFDDLRVEVQKLQNPYGETVDWNRVILLGKEILELKSKNLLVAAYVSFGLLQQYGYKGLLSGLCCMEELIRAFWDSMYPGPHKAIERGRAIGWLIERAQNTIPRKLPSEDDKEALEGCLGTIVRLDKMLDGRVLNDFPRFKLLGQALRDNLERINGLSFGTESPAISPEDRGGPETANQPIGDQTPSLAQAVAMLHRAASRQRDVDPRAAWPYRAIRAVAWVDIESCPPHADFVTKIPPPPDHLRQQYSRLYENASWPELLGRAESDFHGFPFWLDLQCHSSMALSCLGSEYLPAREAAVAEVQAFLRRLPDLCDLKFSDGMPFADTRTRDWLESEVLCPALGSSRDEPESGSQTTRLGELRARWMTFKKEGRVRDAVALWQEEISHTASHRTQFLVRFELAKLCVASRHLRLAQAQFELLDRAIDRFSLPDWEPELALDVLLTWWRSFSPARRTKQMGPEGSREADRLFSRLCQLNAAAAFDLDATKFK